VALELAWRAQAIRREVRRCRSRGGLKAANPHVDEAAGFGEGGVLAQMGASDPGPFGITTMLVGKLPFEH
jgi:hypothetical protein